jgi:Uncharacterized conserved protein (DUF2075)
MYRLSAQKRLVSVKFGKRLSFRDVQSYAESLTADPRFDAGFSEIVDLSDVEELALNPAETIKLADLADPFRSGAKRAFVARTDTQIRAARMHQLLRNDQINIRIFDSLEEAEEWIKSQSRQPTLISVHNTSKIRV